jgi:hypothetical protein
MTLMAVDSDGDLIPDAWEDSHSMDKTIQRMRAWILIATG